MVKDKKKTSAGAKTNIVLSTETNSISTTGEGYLVPALKPNEYHVNEIIIKRSRFITTIAHTSSVEQAKAFIEKISNQYKDANHNCFAFNATAPNSSAFCGCSDDGEPKGTAGQPMLNVVLHCGIGELSVVVTRYFGGVLLGTGGLVKAYQDSVKEALLTLPTCEHMIASILSFGIEHKYVAKVKHILPQYRASIIKEDYAEIVYLEVQLPANKADLLEAELNDMSKGSFKLIARR